MSIYNNLLNNSILSFVNKINNLEILGKFFLKI